MVTKSIELTGQEATRILMALTIRRNNLEDDGFERNTEEYTELCRKIAREFDEGDSNGDD